MNDKPVSSGVTASNKIQWEAIFNAIGNPAIILDRDHRVVAANSASQSLTGLLPEEMVGHYCFDVFHRHGNGLPPPGCPMEKMLCSGVMESTDVEMDALDGTFLVSCTPIPAEDGSIEYVIHIATDITARKEMEKKLIAESNFNRSIIDNAPVGLCVCRAVPEFPYVLFSVWNERMKAVTGYAMEEINSEGLNKLLPSNHASAFQAAERVRRVPAGDDLVGEKWVIVNSLGEEHVLAIWTSPLKSEETNDSFLVFVVDVTEHKTALQEQRSFTDSLVRNAAIPIFVLDREHKVQIWNKACEKLTGVARADIIGKDEQWKAFYEVKQPTLADYILDGDFSQFPKHYDKVSKSAHNQNGYRAEGWCANINGSDRYLIIEAAPIYDRQGEMTCVIETISDMTESKTLEEQLLHAQKMESIGHLAGGIAHEFNNILAVILGYGQVMQKGLVPGSTNMSDLDQILQAADRAASLTKGLLAFSRKQRVTPANFNLNILIHNTLKSFSRIMGDDIIVRENLDSTPITIYADQTLVTQVLMNLMTNARDAMPTGGNLDISTKICEIDEAFSTLHCQVPPGRYARISLSDSGLGMEEETLAKIFEPFFTTKELGRGTGLGLSVVYGIVSQHNGYICVSSDVNHGTVFDLYFPLIENEETNRVTSAVAADVCGGDETILIADDDPNLLMLFSNVLSELGYHVLTAENGVEAVELFTANQDKVKVLVFDVQMPQKNGLQAYKEIKQLKPECRALFVSGYNEEQFQGAMEIEEGADLMNKPFTPLDLAARVRKMLDNVL